MRGYVIPAHLEIIPSIPFSLQAFFSGKAGLFIMTVYCTQPTQPTMAKSLSEVRFSREEFMTPEEMEELDHDFGQEEVSTIPPDIRDILAALPVPDSFGKAGFEKRKPALGLSDDQIDSLEEHYYDNLPQGVQQRLLFKYLRSTMLRNLISPSGCREFSDLCNILRDEFFSGTPAPVPHWYLYSKVRNGPRRVGYFRCESRRCWNTESLEIKFLQCGRCLFASYCSRECQVEDWRARHKKLCKLASNKHAKAKVAGEAPPMMPER